MPRRPVPAGGPARGTTPAQRLPRWAAACFLASGAAGLLYEVVWSKELSYLLGNALHSVATVVAAFLTGLALGALLLGVRLARRRDGARVYALLELGVAALGLASMPVLRGLDPLWGALYHALGGEGPAYFAVRFALLFLLLLPPTLLMGATLPVLVGHFEHRAVGPALAQLYAVNTAGAVAGSLLGGFWLVPGVGLTATTWVAALLNAGAGLLAMAAAGGSLRPEDAALPAAPAGGSALLPAPWRATVGALFALSGFAALALQIAWVRLFGLLFGSSVYSFAAVLAVYLLGLAAGSALVAARTRRPGLVGVFASLELGIALAALGTLRLFPWLPEGFLALARAAAGRWGALYAGQAGLVAAVLLVPCLLLGAVFPVAARLLQSRDGGHATGLAYAVNTAGSLTGTLLAGFVLIPALGVQGTQLVASVLSGSLGLAALALASGRGEVGPRARLAGLALAVAGGLLLFGLPRWDPALMSAGIYRPRELERVVVASERRGASRPSVRIGTRDERTLFYREGVNGSVYVASDSAGRAVWLRVGGKVDASTADMTTQVLLGVLPGACAPPGGRAMVVGLGSGVTASAVLASRPASLEVVEIEPAVVEASRFFFPGGGGPLEDPRARLVLGDARTHLAYARGAYDVIVSEPSNPWMAGVNNLFTVDFYRRVRTRLSARGVFCQWIQLYELSDPARSSLLASFRAVFPRAQAFFVPGGDDLLLLALPAGGELSLARLREPGMRTALGRGGIPEPEALAAFYVGDLDTLAARGLIGPARLNRDDLPVVEYRAPLDLYRVGTESLRAPHRLVETLLRAAAADAPLFAEWPADAWYPGRARQLERLGMTQAALETAGAARRAGLVALAAQLEAEVAAAGQARAAHTEIERARAAVEVGMLVDARLALARATAIDPGSGRAWLLLADVERRLGDAAGARAALARALAVGDSVDRHDAEVVAGVMEVSAGRPLEAAARFRAAQRWQPFGARAYLFEARARAAGGDSAAARAACRRGLRIAPGDPELAALERLLGGAQRQAP